MQKKLLSHVSGCGPLPKDAVLQLDANELVKRGLDLAREGDNYFLVGPKPKEGWSRAFPCMITATSFARALQWQESHRNWLWMRQAQELPQH